jgi:hypothetical protein
VATIFLFSVWKVLQVTPLVPRIFRFTQGNETLFPNWQKESWQTFEETCGCVRPEWVNKWPNSMTYMMMMMNFQVVSIFLENLCTLDY